MCLGGGGSAGGGLLAGEGVGEYKVRGYIWLYTFSSSCSTGRSYPHHWKDAGMEGDPV